MTEANMPRLRRAALVAIGIAALGLAGLSNGHADEAGAKRILKSMADYVSAQKTLSLTFDSEIEVITQELQKIQFTNSGRVLLSRPDKLRASRRSGYADVEMVFDGKVMTLLGKVENAYLQTEAAGSVEQLIGRLRNEFGVALPSADLLLPGVYDDLIAEVIDAKYVGHGVIDGVDCEHLAFRNAEVDWQIWIEIGPRPIPRKYVITSKTMAGAPQYTLRIKEWQADAPVAADAFAFKPPQNAKLVAAAELRHLDEVPPGAVTGGPK